MIKFLFLDYRDHEVVKGFVRRLEPPRKRRRPIMVSDGPFDGDFLSFYGSVIRRPDDGRWQMWYTCMCSGLRLGYAESDDGITWHRPMMDAIKIDDKPTNLVFDQQPHGACVMYDEREDRPGWRYKMLTGAAPSGRIGAVRSPDGIHWKPAAENPVIGTNPDCPMSLHRAFDGTYVAYHRPGFADRRVGRNVSHDFVHWSVPRTVLDQEPGDDPQTQFYGLGSMAYGGYEVGTLWNYHTEVDDMDFHKMQGHQETELSYSRTGYAWHRAALGEPWIKLGRKGSWEWGNIQAASAPVLLENEIRFYYAASRTSHGEAKWAGPEPRWGVSYVSCLPDRFVGIDAEREGRLLSRPFWTEAPEFFVNAAVRKGGSVRVELTDLDGSAVPGFEASKCVPITGDAVRHRVTWKGEPNRSALIDRELRFRVRATQATLYSLACGTEEQARTYWRFRIPAFMDMKAEKLRM